MATKIPTTGGPGVGGNGQNLVCRLQSGHSISRPRNLSHKCKRGKLLVSPGHFAFILVWKFSSYVFAIPIAPATHLQDRVLTATSRTSFAASAWASLSFALDFECSKWGTWNECASRFIVAVQHWVQLWIQATGGIGHICNMVRILFILLIYILVLYW